MPVIGRENSILIGNDILSWTEPVKQDDTPNLLTTY